jgi:hypothetical protein
MREKIIDLGNIELGNHENTERWVRNLKRYQSVRFFGFVLGRVFIGLICGSKGKSKLELTQDALIKVEDKLAVAKQEIAILETSTV